MTTDTGRHVDAAHLATTVAGEVAAGGRFAGLVATAGLDRSTVLRALIAEGNRLAVVEAALAPGERRYPALTPLVESAAWYERSIHDLYGLEPVGHPRLDPLVLPLPPGERPPRPGGGVDPGWLVPDTGPLPGHVTGEGVFTIPYGPVRSGVFESVEFLVETPGEEIPHLRTRVYHKHRGLEQRFGALGVDDGVLLAERVEGTCSVAHAVAFSRCIEELAGVEPSPAAESVRVVHAELERITVHLDSMVRHTEAAGQAVGYARMSLHKEQALRLRSRLCGHRFGRAVVVPGGVSGPLQLDVHAARHQVERLERSLADDARLLMTTPSFLDRLRGTGRLPAEVVRAHGALGPVARGSGVVDDVRVRRPYGAYARLGVEAAEGIDEGDALARQRVRLAEIDHSFRLVRGALEALAAAGPGPWRRPLPPAAGLAVCSVEAPQGELVYVVETDGERLVAVKPRTASFHNLALFPRAFRGDIFTDFAFIEASFGLSIAGAAG